LNLLNGPESLQAQFFVFWIKTPSSQKRDGIPGSLARDGIPVASAIAELQR